MNPIQLTTEQKLEALAMKYYSGYEWKPKTGDYYTTSRADLELYQVVYADENVIKTKYCHPDKGDTISEWDANKFLLDFGVNRVYVADFVLKNESTMYTEEQLKQAFEFYRYKVFPHKETGKVDDFQRFIQSLKNNSK